MFLIIRIILYFRLIGNCFALDSEIIEIENHIFYGMISLYYNKLSINCLIFFSGFCSGATQEAKLRYGNEKEQNMEIHILLSTLLVANLLANESYK